MNYCTLLCNAGLRFVICKTNICSKVRKCRINKGCTTLPKFSAALVRRPHSDITVLQVYYLFNTITPNHGTVHAFGSGCGRRGGQRWSAVPDSRSTTPLQITSATICSVSRLSEHYRLVEGMRCERSRSGSITLPPGNVIYLPGYVLHVRIGVW